MSFLKPSISIMSGDFKSKSCFSSVLGNPGLAVVGELGLGGAMSPWFLLATFLSLIFAIWLSLVLVCPAVSGWSLSHLWACKPVSVSLGYQLSPVTEGCGSSQLQGANRAQKDHVLALPLCHSCDSCAPGCHWSAGSTLEHLHSHWRENLQ